MKFTKIFPQLRRLVGTAVLSQTLAFCASSNVGSGGSSSRSALQARKATAGPVPTRAEIMGLFKDKDNFRNEDTLPGLKSGRTSCATILNREKAMMGSILPWPKDLKDFLADQLEGLPAEGGLSAKAFGSLAAVYLVKKEILTGSDGSMAAGLACDLGGSNLGVLFLNEVTFVEERQAKGLRTFQGFSAVPRPHLLIKTGDNAAITFIHEVFHAVDNKYFRDAANEQVFRARREVIDLSWKASGESRFTSFEALDLAGGHTPAARQAVVSPRGCRAQFDALNLVDGGVGQTPEAVRASLSALAETTNFIVPYAQENWSEDFAESLAVYYFGIYQKSWQRREVYLEDLRKTPDPARRTAIYIADTKAILRVQELQRAKMCALVELVFGKDKEVCSRELN